MLIYLYGPDAYRRHQKLKEIIGKYKTKHDNATVERFYLEAAKDVIHLKDFTKGQSLFGDFKFGIICPSADALKKEFVEILKDNLDSKKTILLIFSEKKLPKEYGFLLKDPVLAQEFSYLEETQLRAFIKKESVQRKLSLSSEDTASLMRTNHLSTWGIINDLDVIALGGKIEYTSAAQNFFALLNKVRCGDLGSLEVLMNTQEPGMLFNIVASQGDQSIKNKMADYDAAIKSGKLQYEEALTDLVLSY